MKFDRNHEIFLTINNRNKYTIFLYILYLISKNLTFITEIYNFYMAILIVLYIEKLFILFIS